MSRGWIGVDFDGTLAYHEAGTGPDAPLGEPIGPMVARVERWLEQGHDVRIFTARVEIGTDVQAQERSNRQRALIAEWCRGVFGRELPITCVKDYHMWVLFDDRAFHVSPNCGLVYGHFPTELY